MYINGAGYFSVHLCVQILFNFRKVVSHIVNESAINAFNRIYICQFCLNLSIFMKHLQWEKKILKIKRKKALAEILQQYWNVTNN